MTQFLAKIRVRSFKIKAVIYITRHQRSVCQSVNASRLTYIISVLFQALTLSALSKTRTTSTSFSGSLQSSTLTVAR